MGRAQAVVRPRSRAVHRRALTPRGRAA